MESSPPPHTAVQPDPPHPHHPGPAAPVPAGTDVPARAARLDLSRMEPPRKLAEARLEEVTIDGICGVY